MIPLLHSILCALLFDANAARRWIRGTVGVLSVSGAIYADKVAALSGSARLADLVRAAALLSAFAVAAHDARKRKAGAVMELKP